MNYPIPDRSKTAFLSYSQNNAKKQNPGLIFERFAPEWNNDSDDMRAAKRKGLEDVQKAADRADKALLKAWNGRWEKIAARSQANPFTLSTDWRLVSGLGRKGVLEVGFTFHRYGFPHLPASSLKGIARAFGLFAVLESCPDIEIESLDKALSLEAEDPAKPKAESFEKQFALLRPIPGPESWKLARDFRDVFGTPECAGLAVFLDGIPTSDKLPKLDLDIMNPHYPRYYAGEEPPTDWQSPIPVLFLTVAAGVNFRFGVGWRRKLTGEEDKRLHTLAGEWLRRGLEELGAGAKTSSGYGYFIEPAKKEGPLPLPSGGSSQDPTPNTPLSGLTWRRARISRDQRSIEPVDSPGHPIHFTKDHVLPKGFTPAAKSEVEYGIQILKDGHELVWVKKLYYPIH